MKRLLMPLVLLACLDTHAAESPQGFKWMCKDTGKNSMQCSIKNDAGYVAGVCVEVVKVCKDGDHIAELCSGPMRPGEVQSRVVRGFEPKVRLLESCQGTEYRDPIVK